MKSYTFGYLFVRLNKLCAVFSVLLGIGAGVFLYSRASSESQSAKYREDDFLRLKLIKLHNAHESTQRRLLLLKAADTFPSKYAAANEQFALDGPIATSEQLRGLRTSLTGVKASNAAMKAFVIDRFELLASSITEKLWAHARELAASEAKNTPDASTTERPPAPPRAASPSPQDSPRDEGVFSSRLTKGEIHDRRGTLSNADTFLRSLEMAAENPENKEILKESISEIEGFLNLLPSLNEPELKTSEVRPEPAVPEAAAPAPAREEFKAERVAMRLHSLKLSVAETMLSNWTVDDALEAAIESYAAEIEKCRHSEADIERIWYDCIGNMTKGIVAGFAVAFILLVLADLTKAVLDTASSTKIAADAYRAATTPPIDTGRQ